MSRSWPWAPIGGTYYTERYLLPGALLQPPSLPPWLGCHSNCLIPSFGGSDFLLCGYSIPFPHPGLRHATPSTHSDTHFFHLFNMGPFSHESPEEVKHKSHTQNLLLFCWGLSSTFWKKSQKILISDFSKPIWYSLLLAFP